MKTRYMLIALCAMPTAISAQQDVIARVDSVFQRWSVAGSPGCAVGATRAGATVISRAYGLADLEHDIRNSPATIFEAGSVSKQFTAGAIMLLVLDGRLALEDDIRKYAPEVPDYGTPITIRHLLTHTSGLRDWGSVAAIGGWSRGARTHTHAHVLDILSRQRGLNFTPGAEYSYSNSGYNLLAIIAARVSGMSFAEFSRTRIFEPLGMTNTQWRDDYTRIVKGRASAYAARGDGFAIDRPIENVYGNGGLLTTVGDLLIWNEALASGKLGGRQLTEMMQTRGVLNSGERITYAAGLVVSAYNGTPEISHTGATSGYRAFLGYYPEQKVGVAVLCNVGTANPGTVGHQVADVLLNLPRVVRAPPTAAPQTNQSSPAAAGDLTQFAGEYYSPDAEATLEVSVVNGRLVARRRPATMLTFAGAGGDEFTSGLGRIRFIRDEGGRVVQLSVRQDRVYDLRFDRVR